MAERHLEKIDADFAIIVKQEVVLIAPGLLIIDMCNICTISLKYQGAKFQLLVSRVG